MMHDLTECWLCGLCLTGETNDWVNHFNEAQNAQIEAALHASIQNYPDYRNLYAI